MNDQPPCARCERRGLSCVLHTSALRNPSEDHRSVGPRPSLPTQYQYRYPNSVPIRSPSLTRQLGLLGQDVSSLFSALQHVCDKLNIEPPPPLLSAQQDGAAQAEQQSADGLDEPAEEEGPDVYELSPPASPSTAQAPIDPYLSSGQPHGKDASSVDGAGVGVGGVGGAAGASSRGSPQRSRRRGAGGEREDLVTKGLLSPERAEALVQRYLRHLDRFLYGIAKRYRDAGEVRRASPTLLAAMCAVAAFQDVGQRETFALCYREYRHLVSTSLFEKRDVEYIRALCIGSFWLLDASRILLSDAIRRAADSRLHRYFHRLTEDAPDSNNIISSVSPPNFAGTAGGSSIGGDLSHDPREDARDKMRLWYLLFVSDRHLSVLHNRDSLLRQEKEAIERRDDFLAPALSGGGPASNLDVRLISQVSLLVIMGQIRDVLGGSERARPTPKTAVVQFAHFARELDQWFARYAPRFEPDEHIGGFPLAGLSMHHQFARLYLHHHALQGLLGPSPSSSSAAHATTTTTGPRPVPAAAATQPIPPYLLPAAAAARDAALAVFATVRDSAAFRGHLVGMPHYFHVMISFAGHFLLEVATRHREQLGLDDGDDPAGDLGRVAAVLAVLARQPAIAQHPMSRALAGLTRRLGECAAGLGVESVLAGSPFHNADYVTLMTGFGGGGGVGGGDVRSGGGGGGVGSGAGAADPMFTSLDMQTMSGLSDDFLYGDFGDFHLPFPESQSQFSA